MIRIPVSNHAFYVTFSPKNIKKKSVLMVTSFYPETIKQAPPVFNMLICGLSSKGF